MEFSNHFYSLPFLIFCYLLLTPLNLRVSSTSTRRESAVVLKLEAKRGPSVSPPLNRIPFTHNVTLTVSLAVGSPPQQVSMVLDTGSELSWLNCKKNTPNAPLVYAPAFSKSYSPVPCSSPTCTTQTRDFTVPVSCDPNKLCHTILTYVDFSSEEGNLATETFRVGNSELPGVVFGCMTSESSSNPSEDAKTTGLLGMNLGALSFISQTRLSKFSYCIPSRDAAGVLVFGEAKFQRLNPPLSYTPLVRVSTRLPSFNRVAYTVQLKGIRVAGTVLPIPESDLKPDHTGAGQTMLDSGTQFTFLLGAAYTPLKNEFKKQTTSLLRPLPDPNFVFQGAMDLCFLVGPSAPVRFASLPAVTLMFDGVEMSVGGEKLLYRIPGMTQGRDQVYCFTFGNSDLMGNEANVIGHHHQQDLWMEFDLQNSRVGLAEVKCDLVSQRLGL